MSFRCPCCTSATYQAISCRIELPDLRSALAWTAEHWDPAPMKLHDRGLTGEDGSPRWSDAFHAYLTTHPRATYRDTGYYKAPMRAALDKLRQRKPLMARYVVALALGNWRTFGPPEAWWLAALRELASRYSQQPIIRPREKSEAQLNAEVAA